MKHPTSYLKMRVLSAVEFAPGDTIRKRIKNVSKQTFLNEHGEKCRFTWRTISTWLYRYKSQGVTTMDPKPRADRGRTRKIELEDLLEAVKAVLPSFKDGKPNNKTQVYRACIERGLLRRERIAPNTFRRLVDQHELFQCDEQVADKIRLAFSKPHANDMWQVDTMFGPHVQSGKGHVQSKLIAFIDDASRVIVHGAFYPDESVASLIDALRCALYKRGVPAQIMADNGAVYTSREIVAICARLGIILSHAPVGDAAAKGKIERYFRGVRADFLSRQLDLSSLEALNAQFRRWVEEEYNARVHSTLGMRPIDRFGLDRKRIRFLPPNRVNDELFFLEENRHVKKDNTFSFKNTRWEAPADLRGRKVAIRFDRARADRVIVFFKDERVGEARPLNAVANDRAPWEALDRRQAILDKAGYGEHGDNVESDIFPLELFNKSDYAGAADGDAAQQGAQS